MTDLLSALRMLYSVSRQYAEEKKSMTRKLTFRENDVARLVRAARKAGLSPQRVEVDQNGTIKVIVTTAPTVSIKPAREIANDQKSKKARRA
jgi:hypothetical protein